MIWHIFKKDWKLLRWQALVVVALAAGSVFADMRSGHFGGADSAATRTAGAIGILSMLAGLFLVAELVQQDPIPGGPQDWLVRPVRRTNLLLAKILFIMLALELPMMIITIAGDVALGFPFGKSLSGDMQDMLSMTISLGLPALAFASLFRGVAETVATAFAAWLALLVAAFILTGNANFPLAGPASGTGLHWVVDASQNCIYLFGALAVLAIQYFRRQTIRARWVAAAVFALTTVTPLMPWQTALAVQRRLSSASGKASSVALAFDSAASRINEGLMEEKQTLCIPLAVSGVPADTWLNVDAVSASLLEASGDTVWTTRIVQNSIGAASPLNLIRGYPDRDRCQPVTLGIDDVHRLADRTALRVRLDYSLTLFGLDKSYAMPVAASADRDQILPDVGRCRTKVGERVDLGCITEEPPNCAMAFLVDKPTGLRSPSVYSCTPNYDPWRSGDASNWGAGLSIPWRNLPDPHIGNWQFVLRTYKPFDHFTRQVTTPEIKLRDWLPR